MKSLFTIHTAFAFCFLLITGCNQATNTEVSENELWEMEKLLLSNGKSIDRSPYNRGIEKALSVRLPWAYSPLTIALKVAGQQMISPEVNMVAKSLSGNELVTEVAVIIEKKKMPDDSVADEYFYIKLKLGGTIWQIADIKHAWKCKKGRGHQNLSAEKCQ